ncbi:hypothetical protein ACFQDZ_21165 [Sulfitobacter pacificus]|uniref:hypothetical protein n=1 Tax=Sulfitobacter pacificus TaxID=1499314 RepID=UPI00361A19EF
MIENASDTRILQLATGLATNSDRAVLLAVMFFVTVGSEQESVNQGVGKLLGKGVITLLHDTHQTRNPDQLDYLDELGSVQMVETVKSLFRMILK